MFVDQPDYTPKTWKDVAMNVTLRKALPSDVPAIRDLVDWYASKRILLSRDLVSYYETIRDYTVAVDQDGKFIGCGGLHVLWSEIGEIRALAVAEDWRGKGVGSAIMRSLVEEARALEMKRLFCLTFEVAFFSHHGFTPHPGQAVPMEVFTEMVLSQDVGVAEFLDLARIKPNTLGNTRMIRDL